MTTSFENSAMKSSFSLSSLRSTQAQNTGPHDQLERPYHSLTKKRKEPCREAWRRSWGSAASGGSTGDGLWPLLQHHYDYIIMDNQIIDSCKEANGELLSINSSVLQGGPRLLNPTAGFNRQWSLSQLTAEFEELCQWLTHVQEEIYSSPENLSNRKLRMTRMSELLSVESRRVKFIEQANAILERIPEASADVTWRMEHLDVKWESLRLLLTPEQQNRGDNCDTVDTAHELRCLRRWLHCMEGRLPPPSLAAARSATYHDLLRKLREHKSSFSLLNGDQTFNRFFYKTPPNSETEDLEIVSSPLKRKQKTDVKPIDELFKIKPNNKKRKIVSSSVARAQDGGTAFISSNLDDASDATHFIKIEVFDIKKIEKVSSNEKWKHSDMRVKLYTKNNSCIYENIQKLIYKISKEIANDNCKKYHFQNDI